MYKTIFIKWPKRYGVWMITRNKLYIPSFMKIILFVQKLFVTCTNFQEKQLLAACTVQGTDRAAPLCEAAGHENS